ncbi:MAG: hypothetical protein ACX94C_09955 [Phycisphaerales bacterium]
MSQSVGKGMLVDAVKNYRIAWRRCNARWDDQNADRFAEEYVNSFDPLVRRAIDAMDRLQSACDEARRTCE